MKWENVQIRVQFQFRKGVRKIVRYNRKSETAGSMVILE